MTIQGSPQGQVWFADHFKQFLSSFKAVLHVQELNHSDHFSIGSLDTITSEEYTSVELILIKEPDYSSGIAIRFEVSFKDHEGQLQKKHMHWIATAINAVDNADEVERFLVTNTVSRLSFPKRQDLAELMSSLRVSETSKLVMVTVQSPKTLDAPNLFTHETAFGSQTMIVEQIRSALRNSHSFSLLVREQRALVMMDMLKRQMKQQIQAGFESIWFDTQKARNGFGLVEAPLGISAGAIRSQRFHKDFKFLTRTTFASPEQFLMFTVLGVEREHQLDKNEPLAIEGLQALFYEIPRQEGFGRFILALPPRSKVKSTDQIRLQKGDTFSLQRNSNSTGIYQCQVERCDSSDGRAVLMGIIKHHHSTATAKHQRPVDAYGLQSDFEAAKAGLSNALRGDMVRLVDLSLKLSSTTRDFRMQCLELWQKSVAGGSVQGSIMRDIILGNGLDQLPQVNMLGNLEGTLNEVNEYLKSIFEDGVSSEQLAAFKLLRSVTGGVFLIDGYAGSGKSRFTRQIMLAHMFRKNAEGQYTKIAVPVAQNETGDTIVKRLLEDAETMKKRLGTTRQPVILRAHKVTAEREIFQE